MQVGLGGGEGLAGGKEPVDEPANTDAGRDGYGALVDLVAVGEDQTRLRLGREPRHSALEVEHAYNARV